MSRKIKEIVLSERECKALEGGYKTDENHSFRQRCKIVLLKSEGYSSKEVGAVMNSNKGSVYNWLNRYEQEGIQGLRTREGQGRKPILAAAHIAVVKAAVQQERQRLSQAQKIIEDNIGKKMSKETLTRFLKVLTAVTSG
jgi:transposase